MLRKNVYSLYKENNKTERSKSTILNTHELEDLTYEGLVLPKFNWNPNSKVFFPTKRIRLFQPILYKNKIIKSYGTIGMKKKETII